MTNNELVLQICIRDDLYFIMGNNYFRFKQFTVNQKESAFRVGTDGVLLGAWADVTGKTRILDIGTGTGLIALMLAQRCDASITAIEPDPGSFREASENIKQSLWAERISIENCTLQSFSGQGKNFDLIVSNPPYFIDSVKNPDPSKSAARHNDNLNHKDLIEGAERLLMDEGDLQLILPFDEGKSFIKEALRKGFFCNKVINIRPSPSSDIKRLIMSFSRKEGDFSEHFIAIEDGKRHHFTKEYIALTKDFYLKF